MTGQSLSNLTDSIFGAINTATSVADDYITKQANLSTQNKNIQLQEDINGQLARIKQNNKFENWNTEINKFFSDVKSGMSNPDSPYYCQNNLQAEQFTKILEQNQVNVSDHVNNLVIQKQQEKNIVDTENSIDSIFQLYTGQEAVDKANESVKLLYETGAITLEQYDARKDKIYMRAYQDMHTKLFDGSFNAALEKNKTKEAFWEDIKKTVPELKATDTYGLEKSIDKTAMDEALKKQAYQYYQARLSDVQQANAMKLSEIVQQMRQQNTAEGKVKVAQRGQRNMNGMLGLQLSEQDRLQYSAIFELALGGSGLKGSGSGSGSSKPSDSFEKLINVAGGEAFELMKSNPELCPYDAAEIYSMQLTKWFMTEDFTENYNKDFAGRSETFGRLYEHSTSKESIAAAVFKEIKGKYPTLSGYIDNKNQGLIDFIKNNKGNVDERALAQLNAFCVDWALSANGNATDADFKKAFDEHYNTFYVSQIKSVTLNDKGNLKQTYNANKAGDIAQAAKIASDNDFVFTDQYGQEQWAPGKKEALEAKGGIVNVLQNAVAGTLDIPESNYKDIGFYYQPDESGNDMSSKPIITYKDKAYEVIPDEKGKGFKVREFSIDENGKMQQTRELEGKTGGKLKEVMRANQKQEAKQEVQNSSRDIAKIKKEREAETNKAITDNTTYPKAMQAAGKVDKDTWNDYKDLETRTYNLRVTANRMDSDAKKMSNTEFMTKYGIDKEVWLEDKVESRRFNLILKS